MSKEKRFRVIEFYSVIWVMLFLLALILPMQIAKLSWPYLLRLFIASNIAAFLLYGLDKIQAITKRVRIPEKTLLLAAFAGGPLGALLAMHLFRHKTRKMSFQFWLAFLLMIEALLVWWIMQ